MWVFFESLLYIFSFMRLFLVIRVNLSGVKRFFVGTIHGLRRMLLRARKDKGEPYILFEHYYTFRSMVWEHDKDH